MFPDAWQRLLKEIVFSEVSKELEEFPITGHTHDLLLSRLFQAAYICPVTHQWTNHYWTAVWMTNYNPAKCAIIWFPKSNWFPPYQVEISTFSAIPNAIPPHKYVHRYAFHLAVTYICNVAVSCFPWGHEKLVEDAFLQLQLWGECSRAGLPALTFQALSDSLSFWAPDASLYASFLALKMLCACTCITAAKPHFWTSCKVSSIAYSTQRMMSKILPTPAHLAQCI